MKDVGMVGLSDLGIQNWDDIKADFQNADVLLGNGFSIGICNQLHYDSLFDCFLTSCVAEDRDKFSAINKTNFEAIMDDLNSASRINNIWGSPNAEIDSAVIKLKRGLATSINAVHPRYSDINLSKLLQISKDLDQFGNVYTINYDLLAYHIVMLTFDRSRTTKGVRTLSDYFWKDADRNYKKFMDFDGMHNRHIYYLHGALFLFRSGADTLKITRDGTTELIDQISKEIDSGRFPLFVSEGTSEEKEEAISKSPYLSFAMRKFRESTNPLVIYGASLADSDRHIREIIGEANPSSRRRREVAVSIYVGTKTRDELEIELANMQGRLPHHLNRINFFDSSTLFCC